MTNRVPQSMERQAPWQRRMRLLRAATPPPMLPGLSAAATLRVVGPASGGGEGLPDLGDGIQEEGIVAVEAAYIMRAMLAARSKRADRRVVRLATRIKAAQRARFGEGWYGAPKDTHGRAKASRAVSMRSRGGEEDPNALEGG